MTEPLDPEVSRTPTKAEAADALDRLLQSSQFRSSPKLCKLLRYLTDQASTASKEVSEYDIAAHVFDRTEFDPATDAIVRRNVLRLRNHLREYFEAEGRWETIRIEIPKGYLPKFIYVTEAVEFPAEAIDPSAAPPPPGGTYVPKGQLPKRASVVLAMSLLAVLSYFLTRTPVQQRTAERPPKVGRSRPFFASSDSEGASTRRIDPGHAYGQLVITPDGKLLYGFDRGSGNTVTVFRTRDLQMVNRVQLGAPIRTAYLTGDGNQLFLTSTEPVVMVLNSGSATLESKILKVTEPVFDVAVTSDHTKLYLGTGASGLKKMDLENGRTQVISPVASANFLNMDPTGKYLFVAYQSGGPGGRPGHDVVDVYDVVTDRRLYQIHDVPMVGAHPLFSPDGLVSLLDSRDACFAPRYDHEGCPSVPSHPFYIWDIKTRQWLRKREFPDRTGDPGAFIPGSRVLLADQAAVIWNWGTEQIQEVIDLPDASRATAVSPDASQLFIAARPPVGGIYVFDARPATCLPAEGGLLNYYPADGASDDVQATGNLRPNGHLRYGTGLHGRAFEFDGVDTYIFTAAGSSFCPYCSQIWTEAFWFKLLDGHGEMTILESANPPTGSVRRLFVSKDRRLVLVSDASHRSPLVTTFAQPLESNRWYHTAITTDHNHRRWYVDGKLVGDQMLKKAGDGNDDIGPLYIGATLGRSKFFHGLLDELVVYNRSLTTAEIIALASRECPH